MSLKGIARSTITCTDWTLNGESHRAARPSSIFTIVRWENAWQADRELEVAGQCTCRNIDRCARVTRLHPATFAADARARAAVARDRTRCRGRLVFAPDVLGASAAERQRGQRNQQARRSSVRHERLLLRWPRPLAPRGAPASLASCTRAADQSSEQIGTATTSAFAAGHDARPRRAAPSSRSWASVGACTSIARAECLHRYSCPAVGVAQPMLKLGRARGSALWSLLARSYGDDGES